jgi:TonB family protein
VAELVLVRSMRFHRVALGFAAIVIATTPLAAWPVISGEQVLKLAVATPTPQYPLAARARHITGSGTFILHIQVRTGLVRYVDVEHTTGSTLLDSAAVAALKKWRFKPGSLPIIAKMKLHGSYPYPTEDSVARVPIDFTMSGVRHRMAGAVISD